MSLEILFADIGLEYRIDGEHHHCTPGFVQIDCPFCSPRSQHFRMGVGRSNLICVCWTCGSHRFGETMFEAAGLRWNDLKDRVSDFLRPFQRRAEGDRRTRGRLVVPKGVGPLKKAHRRYLRERGLDPDQVAQLWKVQGIGFQAELAWTLYLPIYYQGKEVSWTTRQLHDEGKRYHSARPDQESLPLKGLLYGHDLVKHACIVVEGPMDAMRIGPGAVATLGVNTTRAQILKLSQIPKRVICFDNEREAQKRARQLCRNLSVFPGKTLLVNLDSKDPGAASEKELSLLRKEIQ